MIKLLRLWKKSKEKRVLRIELDDDVKKVSITGKNGNEQVVMSQELNEDDLDQVAGGVMYFVKPSCSQV